MAREAEIQIRVELDDQKVPRKIEWNATDAPFEGARIADAVSVAIWDPEDRNTLSFELWTGELTIDEMNFFLLERLIKMTETCRRATQDPEMAALFEDFSRRLSQHMEAKAREKTEGSKYA